MNKILFTLFFLLSMDFPPFEGPTNPFPLFFGFVWILILGLWAVFLVIAIIVYYDAEKHGMNGPLWFILVIIMPFSLIVYLIIREERDEGLFYGKNAREILDARYARGELTTEEYQRKKRELEGEGEKKGEEGRYKKG